MNLDSIGDFWPEVGIGFVGLFTIGGLTGLFLASVGLDVHVTDTYFIVVQSTTSWSAAI